MGIFYDVQKWQFFFNLLTFSDHGGQSITLKVVYTNFYKKQVYPSVKLGSSRVELEVYFKYIKCR